MNITNYIILKDPKPFAPDRVFRVPECFAKGYVNLNFKFACEWYDQVWPIEEVDDEKS